MNHDDFRELLALRIYGELDGDEASRLDRHLAQCAACSSYARELEGGLATVPRAGRAGAELPADWSQRLEQATRSARPARRLVPWLTAAAGFAAGIIAYGAAAAGPRDPEPAESRVALVPGAGESVFARFAREATPPAASTGGPLAQVAGYLRR